MIFDPFIIADAINRRVSQKSRIQGAAASYVSNVSDVSDVSDVAVVSDVSLVFVALPHPHRGERAWRSGPS